MNQGQIANVHIAKSQLKLNDQEYRLILRNVAGVASSKDLDNQKLEKVMAFFEERGFRQKDQPADYWRRKYHAQDYFAGERLCHKIQELSSHVKYAIDALVAQVSKGRTARAEELTPAEGNNLVEMLKSIAARKAGPAGSQHGLNTKARRHEGQLASHDLFGNPLAGAPVFQYAGPLPPPNPDGSYTVALTATNTKPRSYSITCKPITDDEVPF